jgi:hypothetical protein
MPLSYEDEINYAKTTMQLNDILSRIEKNTTLKCYNISRQNMLIKSIKDKIDHLNKSKDEDDEDDDDDDDDDEDDEKEAEPPAKRIKIDKLDELLNKKNIAERKYLKCKADKHDYMISRKKIMDEMDIFVFNYPDLKYKISTIVSDVDKRNFSSNVTKKIDDIFHLTHLITLCEDNIKEHYKIYNNYVTEVNEYVKKV